ncbi:Spy/CpxP family protein refolding chaperone [Phenylobacterium sp. J367]|uniref:Spy/CpxP family protein refolding chaperone n=1 Tax=Phenylobacterium sp. J367 TaxID=2898435 RepID=UPI00215085D0|nr:Spy/CpxP family protein refolding chaperone [Phenylobacterium sp. J367]MCR5878227.1 Spy/CpxP family protein refolding chaperone [Phenylobacterium sp. J367]
MSRMTKPVLAAALAALFAGGALAQTPDAAIRQAQEDARKAQSEARDAQSRAHQARQHAERTRERVHRMVVQRLGDEGDRTEHLRNILQLRPNQEAALKTYVEALKPKPVVRRFDAETESRKTTTQRLAEMEQRIAEREAASRARIQATRAFYGQLDDKQKKAFDELPLMMGPDHFGPGPMRTIHFMHDTPHGDHGVFRGMPAEIMPPAPPAPPVPPAPPAPPAGV